MKDITESVNEVLDFIKHQEYKAMLIWFIKKDDQIGVLDRIAIVRDDTDNFERLSKIAERDSFECFIQSSDGKEWLEINGEELRRQFTNLALRNAGY